MKKISFVILLIVCAAMAGRETQASVQRAKTEDPCFISSLSWYPCGNEDFQVAGYPQEDGTYYYYAWQCPSFSCPL